MTEIPAFGVLQPIGSAARQVDKTGEYPQDFFYPSTNASLYDHDAGGRKDRYTVIAVIIKHVIDSALHPKNTHLDTGLSAFQPPQEKPFKTLESQIKESLCAVYDHEVHACLENPNSFPKPFRDAVQHYRDWIGVQDVSSWNDNQRIDIKTGIHTAARVMSRLAKAIPEVYESQYQQVPEHSILTEIADNSFGVVQNMAGLDLTTFSLLLNLIEKEDSFDANCFEIQMFKGKPRLAFTPDIRREVIKKRAAIKPYSFINPRNGQQIVLGDIYSKCPALVVFGGKSAVKKVWEKNVELAALIYEHEYPTRVSQDNESIAGVSFSPQQPSEHQTR